MKLKIIVSVAVALYYISCILYQSKKDNDKEKIKILSISLMIFYIIFLLLIWLDI